MGVFSEAGWVLTETKDQRRDEMRSHYLSTPGPLLWVISISLFLRERRRRRAALFTEEEPLSKSLESVCFDLYMKTLNGVSLSVKLKSLTVWNIYEAATANSGAFIVMKEVNKVFVANFLQLAAQEFQPQRKKREGGILILNSS